MSPTAAASSGNVDSTRSGPLRSKPSSEVTWCQPSPIWPNTMSSATKASSRITSLKWWLPFIDTMGRTSTPGPSNLTMNWLRPACRCAGSTGAVRASTMKACARCAPEVHTLVPVSDHPPSTRIARVRTLARSEPESGSLIPMPKKHSPAAISRQELPLLCIGAVFEQRGHDLAVGDPVRGHRCARREQLLGHDEALEE